MNKKNLLKFWLPVFLYAIFIFFLSSIPGEALPESPPIIINLFHLIEYIVFGLLLARALKNSYHLSTLRLIFLSTFLASFYGMTDEIHQVFISLRDASIFDVILDSTGGFLGSIINSNIKYQTSK